MSLLFDDSSDCIADFCSGFRKKDLEMRCWEKAGVPIVYSMSVCPNSGLTYGLMHTISKFNDPNPAIFPFISTLYHSV